MLPSQSCLSSVTITRPSNTTAYDALDAIGITAGTRQVETATAAGTVTAAVLQVETATVVGTITTAGNAAVVVTGSALENSPKTFAVPVLLSDDESAIALAIRTALAADENIDDAYTVSGATDKVILTAKVAAANDATLNIAVDNGTCEGITTAASSANTTGGVASGAGNAAVVVTSALIVGSPVSFSVAVAAGDDDETWADKVRTALAASTRITEFYTVGGATTDIILTAIAPAANDATLNISLDNGTSTGITTAASSADTTSGAVASATAGSAILTFGTAGRRGGDSVYITDVNLRWDVTALPSGATTFRLHLYNAPPDAIVDNAAWDLSSAADRTKYLGYVDLSAPVDLGSTLVSQNPKVNRLVRLEAANSVAASKLYGILQTIGGYTPASGSVMAVDVATVLA